MSASEKAPADDPGTREPVERFVGIFPEGWTGGDDSVTWARRQRSALASTGAAMTAVRVYVAGPYSADPEECTRRAIEAGDALLDEGFAPFVPHLSHYWHTLHRERGYEDWMRLDFAWVAAAQAVLRLPGESPGADREVTLARSLGIPVLGSVEELVAWRESAAVMRGGA